jgi:hypothetical protein
MGTPIVRLSGNSVEQDMYMETGEKLYYVDKTIGARLSSVGKEIEFHLFVQTKH